MTSPSDEAQISYEIFADETDHSVKTDPSLPDWPWLYGNGKVLSKATCEATDDPESKAHSYSLQTSRSSIDGEVYDVYLCSKCEQRMFRLKI